LFAKIAEGSDAFPAPKNQYVLEVRESQGAVVSASDGVIRMRQRRNRDLSCATHRPGEGIIDESTSI
jgi:hypothetical protein